MLDPAVRRVLDGTSIAHLATVLPDGSPHTTPVYVGTQGERIVFFTGPSMRKARNLRRDPRLALSIAPVDNPFEPVVVRGRVVEWLEGDVAWEIIDRLA
ncbi:MAG TPA: pyridoxamine 5'-phosphate oxidase family protein, partial [Nonomuraea sp.]|nr:pyridoxamine 5'-phosphate oxidase family protein [Nonomuraea sp.]